MPVRAKEHTVKYSDVEVLEFIPEERSKKRRETLLKQLNSFISVFERPDEEGNGLPRVDVRDVGIIARTMGLNPTEEQILWMVEDIEEPESHGSVRSERVRQLLLNILETHVFRDTSMVRDSEEQIVAAFKLLDPESKGFIPKETLMNFMTTTGEAFSGTEIEEMITASVDPETGHILYDDFASILAHE